MSRTYWRVVEAIRLTYSLHRTNHAQTKTAFLEICGIPGIIGCVDCTHVEIIAPNNYAEQYCNRKGWFSVNCQAICDHRYRIWDAVIRWPGSVHDSRIFRHSHINQKLSVSEIDGILLGDSGYPLFKYLMTSYRDPTTDVQRNFNNCLSIGRVRIEMTFGLLKRRFACLNKPLRVPIERERENQTRQIL